ncbi:MAG: SbcC/MukB-like Walker B domain-containing protein [Opitutaceae bacterium]|jgi:uncharacterized protein YPO0396
MPEPTPVNSSVPQQGWRLWRLELCNWGTFHRKVWSLVPQAGWTLLVGENGSGKSTAVDGLRTLLVPPKLLNYNDASGNQSRRDRSRVSYIRGAWAATAMEDSHLARTEYLRAEGELSLVLAVFRCGVAEKAVTLAQVLWAQDGRPEELFLVAEGEHSIRDHLGDLKGGKRELRDALRKRQWDVHDTFRAYSARFRSLLGIPGDGALEVFNQAIGVKEVDDVNRFVRRHLLEAGEALKFVDETLIPLYKELLACWDRIQRAEQQIAQLRPIATAHQSAEDARGKLKEIARQQAILRPYYFETERKLRRTLAAELSEVRLTLERQKTEETDNQASDQETRDSLRAELDSGALGLRLKALELDIGVAKAEANTREIATRDLASKLKVLGEPPSVSDAAGLIALQTRWGSERPLVEGNRDAMRDKQVRFLQERQGHDDDLKRLRTAAQALKDHRVNIDDAYLQVRSAIAREAQIPETDLPFAGELIEVRAEYREWTGALERLLRTFGLSLLVPELHIATVYRIVNRRHWGMRLQLFRVATDMPRDVPLSRGNRQVGDRLAFRDKHPLTPWVATEVRRAFPHTCCADEAELERESYALTKEGLIRSGTRHVKDDRHHVNDATNYVLGCSVEDKLRAISERLVEVQKAFTDAEHKAAEAARNVATLENRLTAIDAVVAVLSFNTIDLEGTQRCLLSLQKEHTDLEQSSDQRKDLKQKLEKIEIAIGKRKTGLERLERDLGKNEMAAAANESRLTQIADELKDFAATDWTDLHPVFTELREGQPAVLEKLDQQRDAAEKRLRGRQDRQNGTIRDALKEMLPAMTTFLSEYPEFTKSLAAKEEFAADFVKLLGRLEHHELPGYKDRFEEYLNTNLVGNMAMFNSRLDGQLEAAREKITAVNTSLREIAFTATTYVQIVDRVVTGGEIGPFKARLRECIAGGINPTTEDRMRIFHAIRSLLDDFTAKPEWAERVTDVRNWLEFGVRELNKTDDRQVDYFAASSGKSGGQKARLAFSILASAILSQYGLAASGSSLGNTFRLVVIDEVFSRTDEENSRRALDLFQKLGLQLIVVSPFDAKARIVEDYVDSYHLALNPERNNSSLQRATREQYEQAWQEATVPDGQK